jgi:hypothetical protein
MLNANSSIDKKLRKRVDAWIDGIAGLDIKAIQGEGRFYEKIRLSPRSVIAESCPPKWLAHYLPSMMERAAFAWRAALDLAFGKLGANVYLWIFERDILGSQLVCDFGDLLGFYENTFEPCPKSRHTGRRVRLPQWRPDSPLGRSNTIPRPDSWEIVWERRIKRGYKYSGLDGLSARETRRLERIARVSRVDIQGRFETAFEFFEDFVWVGRL